MEAMKWLWLYQELLETVDESSTLTSQSDSRSRIGGAAWRVPSRSGKTEFANSATDWPMRIDGRALTCLHQVKELDRCR